ncbi:MAG: cell division protein FtsL [Gammaproteobacteria bacterium]|nr:MAG: cell division protein FtsL [Gammaproteobacteria bacterium]
MTALATGLLALGAVCSAIGVVYARHEARKLFIGLQALASERDGLNIDWGRLQIEHSTWASPGRIEQMARDRLKMREPDPAAVVIVEP